MRSDYHPKAYVHLVNILIPAYKKAIGEQILAEIICSHLSNLLNFCKHVNIMSQERFAGHSAFGSVY